jgi:hypothetical protein
MDPMVKIALEVAQEFCFHDLRNTERDFVEYRTEAGYSEEEINRDLRIAQRDSTMFARRLARWGFRVIRDREKENAVS